MLKHIKKDVGVLLAAVPVGGDSLAELSWGFIELQGHRIS